MRILATHSTLDAALAAKFLLLLEDPAIGLAAAETALAGGAL
jgi:hypothetical protein